MWERVSFVMLLAVLSYVFPLSLEAETSDSTSHRQNTMIAMPLINNSPAMKTGFGGICMYMFTADRNDNISPASVNEAIDIPRHVVGPFDANVSEFATLCVIVDFWTGSVELRKA